MTGSIKTLNLNIIICNKFQLKDWGCVSDYLSIINKYINKKNNNKEHIENKTNTVHSEQTLISER